MLDRLSKENINDITKAICETKNAEYIYCFAVGMKDRLSPDNINDLTKAICETKNAEYICSFIFDNISKITSDQRKKLINELIALENMRYIILIALYIDNSIIFDIFGTINNLYMYIMSSELFTEEEIIELQEKIYGKLNFMDMGTAHINAKKMALKNN